jgi:nitrile hydratase
VDGAHDLGGMQGFGHVTGPGADAPYHHSWEARSFALTMVVSQLGLTSGHFRESIEVMPPPDYLAASYYERWLSGAVTRLIAKGTIIDKDLSAMEDRLRAGEEPPTSVEPELTGRVLESLAERYPLTPAGETRFVVGNRVRVRRQRPPRHTRVPRYIRGAEGVVVAVWGCEPLPDAQAVGREEIVPVYCVEFASQELFGPSAEPDYDIRVDVYEPYLEIR